MSTACSLGFPLADPGLDRGGSPSLGLFVLVGFVLGDFAGDAVTGGGR